MLFVKYFSTIREPIGAAHVDPHPPFSTYTAIAIFGLYFGANAINIE